MSDSIDFFMIIVTLTFVSSIILFFAVLYIYDRQLVLYDKHNKVDDYMKLNEHQLKNLIVDINKNDIKLKDLIHKLHLD